MAILNQRDLRSTRARITQILGALSPDGAINEIVTHAPAELTAARQHALKTELERLQGEVAAYESLQEEGLSSDREFDTDDLGLLPILGRIARHLSQRDLAERLELKEQQIQRYESDKYSGMSVARYQKMLKALGIELHPRLTSNWENKESEITEADLHLEPEILREIRKRNWIELAKNLPKPEIVQQVREYLDASLQLIKGRPLHRKSINSDADAAQVPLDLWLARILQESAKQRSKVRAKFNLADTSWLKQLAMLSVYPDGPLKAVELLREKGIVLVVEPQLPHTLLDGAALLLMGSIPVIGMTIRYDRLDNFWFTLFHELGHIFLHFNHGLESGFVDDLDDASVEEAEIQADSFARSHLLPDEVWNSAPARFSKAPDAIVNFAKSRNIHPAIVAGRIRRDRANYRIFDELIGRGQVRRLFG